MNILLSLLCTATPIRLADDQEDIAIFRHPEFSMQISGSSHWSTLYNPSESNSFEVINTNNNMHITMWYSETGVDADSYLREFASKQGYIYTDGPNDTVLNEYSASYLKAASVSNRSPSRLFIAAIRDDSGIFVFQMKCPEDCYLSHHDLICKVLASLRVGN